MSWWFVTYADDGAVIDCVPTKVDATASVAGVRSIVVEAPDRDAAIEQASQLWYRMYCNETKKETRVRLDAENRCRCGRARDRKHPDGSWMKTCATCAAYQTAANERYQQRIKDGTVGTHVRDEQSRVNLNLARQRDRRREIRLETLVAVRQQFWGTATVREFVEWLDGEIKAEAEPKKLL